jgi:putative membrane protein
MPIDYSGLPTNDALAVERTRLANQRTLLAYIRTFIFLLSSGLAITQLHMLREIYFLGIGLIVAAPVVLGIGIWSSDRVNKRIHKVVERYGLFNAD